MNVFVYLVRSSEVSPSWLHGGAHDDVSGVVTLLAFGIMSATMRIIKLIFQFIYLFFLMCKEVIDIVEKSSTTSS